jgi:hypothetical protein
LFLIHEQVEKTKRSIQITRRGKVIADIRFMLPGKRPSWLGRMEDTAEITGDIVSPVIDLEDIEALKDWKAQPCWLLQYLISYFQNRKQNCYLRPAFMLCFS